jgi:hypothetical protein
VLLRASMFALAVILTIFGLASTGASASPSHKVGSSFGSSIRPHWGGGGGSGKVSRAYAAPKNVDWGDGFIYCQRR